MKNGRGITTSKGKIKARNNIQVFCFNPMSQRFDKIVETFRVDGFSVWTVAQWSQMEFFRSKKF